MRINHNIIALNSINILKKNSKQLGSSMEKLSSGLRINRAADNAAGLAISEKMRAQIRGLSKAEQNIQDGISLISVAEGGLENITDLLQRARELAIQSSNGTLNEADRLFIQNEVDELVSGVNEIANQTQFNGINLLNVFKIENIPTGIYEESTSVIDISKASSITLWEKTADVIYERTYAIDDLVNGVIWDNHSGETYEFSVDLDNNTFKSHAIKSDTSASLNNICAIRLNGLMVDEYESETAWATNVVDYYGSFSETNVKKVLGNDLSTFPTQGNVLDSYFTVNFESRKMIFKEKYLETPSLILQVGENAGDNFKIQLSDVRARRLGIEDLDFTSKEGSNIAIKKLDLALDSVLNELSKYGSYYNRLNHINNNLSVYQVNLTESESRIRDVDYALAA